MFFLEKYQIRIYFSRNIPDMSVFGPGEGGGGVLDGLKKKIYPGWFLKSRGSLGSSSELLKPCSESPWTSELLDSHKCSKTLCTRFYCYFECRFMYFTCQSHLESLFCNRYEEVNMAKQSHQKNQSARRLSISDTLICLGKLCEMTSWWQKMWVCF